MQMFINAIENAGMKLGTEAINILQEYYPIVQRRIFVERTIDIIIQSILLLISIGAIIWVYKNWNNDKYRNFGEPTPALLIPLLVGIFLVVTNAIFLIADIKDLLTLDYTTINHIIEQLHELKIK